MGEGFIKRIIFLLILELTKIKKYDIFYSHEKGLEEKQNDENPSNLLKKFTETKAFKGASDSLYKLGEKIGGKTIDKVVNSLANQPTLKKIMNPKILKKIIKI
ncbi:hypothetical protein CWO85_02945 [Candidatus Phytoplasma ziziphi]|uniref:Uncharacterized protein n=1 Tax=Ziziphus jujuba witches'-broom phytoplasma TaxID=135727 RepID=A0A660HN44_ZIZJU|nr:hypothetical protein [Candidatus Phytoplasma ziziphi]AYJ01435.1 hypothetical protein CWO85_02945 [Candidatus Phytoplasma ziziphi]